VEAGAQSHHSYSNDEVAAYCDHLNFYLKDDPHVKDVIPVKEEGTGLFDIMDDGIILCKMINLA
jgi:plastin-1